MRRTMSIASATVLCAGVLHAQAPAEPRELAIKYVRDSQEYAMLTRQVYRAAADAVRRAVEPQARTPWAVVLDIDETTLDNSAFQLDRAAYHLPYDSASWNAWVWRREAGAVPGVTTFVATVREMGGHVVWITNRDTVTRDATRANLQAFGLWGDDDRLCTQDTNQHTKRARRAEVVAGTGACAWSGVPTRIIAFIGDQMADFPDAAEQIPDTGSDDAFGRTCFLIPNPTYGQWTTRVTRVP